MGKVKSSIITAIYVVAIAVLAFFATISFNVIGTNGVKAYNSFMTNIHLGSDFTGEAYALLYPEGVISSENYNLVVNDAASDEKAEYEEKYEKHGGVYVEKDKLGDELIKSVKDDANVIKSRLGDKGYSSFTVSVEDGLVIKITLPTNYTYYAYRNEGSIGLDGGSRSESLQILAHAVQTLTYDGEMSLRDESSGIYKVGTDKFADYFTGIDHFSMGGTHAVRFNLTKDGYDKLNAVINGEESGSAKIYVGEHDTGMTINYGADNALTSRSPLFQAEESTAADTSILLESVRRGNVVKNVYNDDGINSTSLVQLTPTFGEYAAIYLAVIMLLVIVAAVVYSIIKYKKLGLVCTLTILSYALAMIIIPMLTGLQITVAGALAIVLGLILLVFSNYLSFEAIRKETALGRTIQAAVKTGYKKVLFTVLDLHVVSLIASIALALIGAGELATCGALLFAATLASYALYWVTRFMWYVISSPVKDKFKFCGYAREAIDDED